MVARLRAAGDWIQPRICLRSRLGGDSRVADASWSVIIVAASHCAMSASGAGLSRNCAAVLGFYDINTVDAGCSRSSFRLQSQCLPSTSWRSARTGLGSAGAATRRALVHAPEQKPAFMKGPWRPARRVMHHFVIVGPPRSGLGPDRERRVPERPIGRRHLCEPRRQVGHPHEGTGALEVGRIGAGCGARVVSLGRSGHG
jgi:hypothetical protein